MLFLHVSTLLFNRQGARINILLKLHKYVNVVFDNIRFHGNPPGESQFVHGVEGRTEGRTEGRKEGRTEGRTKKDDEVKK